MRREPPTITVTLPQLQRRRGPGARSQNETGSRTIRVKG